MRSSACNCNVARLKLNMYADMNNDRVQQLISIGKTLKKKKAQETTPSGRRFGVYVMLLCTRNDTVHRM